MGPSNGLWCPIMLNVRLGLNLMAGWHCSSGPDAGVLSWNAEVEARKVKRSTMLAEEWIGRSNKSQEVLEIAAYSEKS